MYKIIYRRYFSQLIYVWPVILIWFGITVTACEKAEKTIFIPPVTEPVGWTRLFVDISENLNDIYFVNDNSGWIVGENQTLISTASADKGWSKAPVLLPLENLRSVYFVNDQVGWIVGDLSGSTISGQIAYTNNGGGYPSQQETVENPLNALFFVDNQLGWAAGENGLVVKTQNGGSNWIRATPFTTNNITDLYFLNENQGWAVTTQGGIFYTQDGSTWLQEDSGIDSDIHAIHFIDTQGWACGDKNTILRMESGPNGSKTWNRYTISTESVNIKWNDIFFVDVATGWVAGESGILYKSTDGGITWTSENSNVTSNLNAIHMVSTRRGWVVGDSGVVISYTE